MFNETLELKLNLLDTVILAYVTSSTLTETIFTAKKKA
jgi:hypothetical protein